MKKRTKFLQRSKLQLEQLEPRLPLAGNVTLALSGATDLKITGDDAENDISIALVGTNWEITGNNTNVTFNGVVAAGATVPEPAGGRFRKVTIDFKKGLTAQGAAGVDRLTLDDVQTVGDLKITGKNAGVVAIDNLNTSGKTTLAFGDGVSSGAVGTTIDISNSVLGFIQGKTGKDTSVTTGKTSSDRVVITDTSFGKSLTINAKDGDNTVALLGTRADVGGIVLSSTTVTSKLTITTGAGNDDVAVVGAVVGNNLKVTTGKGNDFHGAGGVVIKGTSSIASTDGDDIAIMGLRDINSQPFPPGGFGNQLLGKVTVSMGNGNDLVAAAGTTFGNKVTATMGAGDDTLAEDANTYTLGAADALKASRGGTHFNGDNLLSSAGLIFDPEVLKKGQFEKTDVSVLPALIDQVFTAVDNGFREILLAYGLDIGDPGSANDTDDQISEAVALLLGDNAGALAGSADVDMFSIDVTAGQKFSFALATPPFDAVLRLFTAGGTQLAIQDSADPAASEELEFTFPAAGTFFISVSSFPNINFSALDGTGDQFGGGSGAYDLKVSLV